MAGIFTEFADILSRLQKIKGDVSALQLREEIVALREILVTVRQTVLDQREEIADLKKKLAVATSGEGCSLCQTGQLVVIASTPHPDFGFAGVQMRSLACTSCGHREDRMHDPSGLITRN
jgi:hypothetical protein